MVPFLLSLSMEFYIVNLGLLVFLHNRILACKALLIFSGMKKPRVRLRLLMDGVRRSVED